MNLINQQTMLPKLVQLAKNKRHNILISGIKECGKTYMAKLYAKELNIEDFQIVESKMSSVKTAMENCLNINSPIVLCIENLDLGVNSVSYAILKFLEEPTENVYIIVTCRNIKKIPNTILSRCTTLTLSPIAESDLVLYAKDHNNIQFLQVYRDSILWKCVKSISDVDILINLNKYQIDYFKKFPEILSSKDPVSNMIYKLQKFPDGTSTPIEIVIRYLMYSITSNIVFDACHECLMSLSYGKLGIHAILAKFVFKIKYS